MKVMKAKKISMIAKGKRAKWSVFRGTKTKTDQGQVDVKQTWQSCLQGAFGSIQEALCNVEDKGLDTIPANCQKANEHHGFMPRSSLCSMPELPESLFRG